MIASLRSTWILVGALALAVALACGGDSKESGPGGKAPGKPSAAAEKPAAKPRITTPPVRTTELPGDFPTDVPLYPGAKVVEARVSGDEGMSVAFSTDDASDKVAAFYADSFAAQGWSTDMKPAPDGKAIFADKTERRVAAMVRTTDEGTRIDLIIVPMR